MAEPLRDPIALTNSPREEPAVEDHSIDYLLAGFAPEGTLYRSENPRLNRAAQSIGAAVGTAVGKMRSGLSLVQARERELARDLSQRVSEQAEGLSAAVVEKPEQFGDVAEEKASEFLDVAQEQWDKLSEQARQRLIELRTQAATLRDEHPLELIGAFSGAAFVIGAALKVWRSTHD